MSEVYNVGDVVDARVVRVVPFGVIFELPGEVPGLLVGKDQPAGKERPETGSTVAVQIAQFDAENRRVRVTLA